MQHKRKPETQEEKAERRRNRELSDLVKILQIPEGRRFLWRAMGQGGIFLDPYVQGDSYATTYNSGRKSVSLWALREVMAADPNAFTRMQREHESEAKSEETLLEKELETKDILTTDE